LERFSNNQIFFSVVFSVYFCYNFNIQIIRFYKSNKKSIRFEIFYKLNQIIAFMKERL